MLLANCQKASGNFALAARWPLLPNKITIRRQKASYNLSESFLQFARMLLAILRLLRFLAHLIQSPPLVTRYCTPLATKGTGILHRGFSVLLAPFGACCAVGVVGPRYCTVPATGAGYHKAAGITRPINSGGVFR